MSGSLDLSNLSVLQGGFQSGDILVVLRKPAGGGTPTLGLLDEGNSGIVDATARANATAAANTANAALPKSALPASAPFVGTDANGNPVAKQASGVSAPANAAVLGSDTGGNLVAQQIGNIPASAPGFRSDGSGNLVALATPTTDSLYWIKADGTAAPVGLGTSLSISNGALVVAGGTGGTPAESGTITAGATSLTTGASESFTYSVVNVSTPYVAWVASGSTSVGATAPALVGSAVAVASGGTSGSINAPGTAATYQLALLDAAAGKVLALSAAVTVSAGASIAAMTLSNPTYGTLASTTMLTAGKGSVPANLIPTDGSVYYWAVSFFGHLAGFTSGSQGLDLLSSSTFELYLDSATGSIVLFNSRASGSQYFVINGTPNNGATDTKHTLWMVNGGTNVDLYLDGTLLLSEQGQNLGAQTGSIYVGADTSGNGGIPPGSGICDVALIHANPGLQGFVAPGPAPYTDANTAGLIATWGLHGNGSGHS